MWQCLLGKHIPTLSRYLARKKFKRWPVCNGWRIFKPLYVCNHGKLRNNTQLHTINLSTKLSHNGNTFALFYLLSLFWDNFWFCCNPLPHRRNPPPAVNIVTTLHLPSYSIIMADNRHDEDFGGDPWIGHLSAMTTAQTYIPGCPGATQLPTLSKNGING